MRDASLRTCNRVHIKLYITYDLFFSSAVIEYVQNNLPMLFRQGIKKCLVYITISEQATIVIPSVSVFHTVSRGGGDGRGDPKVTPEFDKNIYLASLLWS